MKRLMKSFLIAVIALAMLTSGMTGSVMKVKAADGDKIYISDNDVDLTLVPGETKHIKIPVKSTDVAMLVTSLSLVAEENSPFTMSQPTITLPSGNRATSFSNYSAVNVEFDVYAKETAKIGTYTVTLNAVSTADPDNPDTRTLAFDLQILTEKAPAQLTVSDINYKSALIGQNTELSFTVKNEGEIKALNTYVSIEYADTGIVANYSTKKIKIGDISGGVSQLVKLPISILSNALAGNKTLTVNFTYKDDNGSSYTDSSDIYVKVQNGSSNAPDLIIDDINYDGDLKPGGNFNLNVTLKNSGLADAENVIISIDPTSLSTSGILKNYFSDGVSGYGIKVNAAKTVNIPLTVSKNATGNIYEVKLIITYQDKDGVSYSTTNTADVNVVAATTVSGSANLIISNVTQNPAQPVAGDKVEISFDIENRSNVDVSELKISTPGLTEATFIPVLSDPYQYFDLLKGGDKIRVTIPLIVSTMIPEGLNNIAVNMTYNGGGSDSETIPIKDIQNKTGNINKPVLIVDQYSTDIQELRAGSTFSFTFDIKNTNATVAAKNITITVKEPDNLGVFSVANGSNSFYISKIDPNETASETLNMKVKSDASTNSYPLDIVMEYDYDGGKPQDGSISDVSKTVEINLTAVENSRPVVDGINVYSMDGMVSVGNPATLSMNFYNMGRSQLNNVTVTVEGDFQESDGSMYFIGNVAAGTSTYAEFGVTPNVEGTSNGTLRITFEDSNGDTVEFTKDFSSQVMAAGGGINPGNGGMVTPGDGSTGVFNPDASTAKKPIMPGWAFVLMECVIFIMFIPITRKIIISVYKAKLRRKEQEQYYNSGSGAL